MGIDEGIYVVLPNMDLMKCDVVGGCCIVALNFFTTGAAKSGSFLMFSCDDDVVNCRLNQESF